MPQHPSVFASDVASLVEALLKNTVLGDRFGALLGAELSVQQRNSLSLIAGTATALLRGQVGFNWRQPDSDVWVRRANYAVYSIPEVASRLEQMPWHGPPELGCAALAQNGHRSVSEADPGRDLFGPALPIIDALLDVYSDRCVSFPHVHVENVFSGLVAWAVRLATDLFPPGERSFEESRQLAAETLIRTGIDVRNIRLRGDLARTSQILRGLDPRPIQLLFQEQIPTGTGHLYVGEAGTSEGKTRLATTLFHRLFHEASVDGIAYALNTRAAVFAMYPRINEHFQMLFQGEGPPLVLGLFDENYVDGQCLTVGQEANPMLTGELRFRAWAAVSKDCQFLCTSVVTTLDQLRLMYSRSKHADLRAAGAARHLLVIDEPPSSDAALGEYIGHIVRCHLAMGGSVLIISAAISQTMRRDFSRELEIPLLRAFPPPLPYPLVTRSDGQRAFLGWAPASTVHRELETQTLPIIGDPEAIAALALSFARQGCKVGVVRNLKRDVLDVFYRLRRLATEQGCENLLFAPVEGVYTPFHGQYGARDQTTMARHLITEFGRQQRQNPCVVVGTLNIQDSLNIDFDVLITDLSPFDRILHRSGRTGRFAIQERAHAPLLIVLTPVDRDLTRTIGNNGGPRPEHGLGSIYYDLRMIEASWRWLEQHPLLALPQMNRGALLATLEEDALQLLGPAWAAHARWVSTRRSRRLLDMRQRMMLPEGRFSSRPAIIPGGGRGSRSVLVTVRGNLETPLHNSCPSFWLPAHEVYPDPRESEQFLTVDVEPTNGGSRLVPRSRRHNPRALIYNEIGVFAEGPVEELEFPEEL